MIGSPAAQETIASMAADGDDTFLFGDASGTDTVYDFAAGDALRFSGTDLDAEHVTIAQSGTTAVVTFAGHDDIQVRLANTDAADLSGTSITDDSGTAFVISVDALS